MWKRLRILAFFLITTSGSSQELIAEYQVMPKGGREQYEQVLQTQLSLPEKVLTRDFEAEIKVRFDLDSSGAAANLFVEGTNDRALRREISRIMSFYKFQNNPLQFANPRPYLMVFSLSTAKYKRYLKQRTRMRIKPVTCDSSMAVYAKADRSPSFHRNDETGLSEFILSEIAYPAAAKDKSVQGTVIVDFIVETNGFVTCVEPRTHVAAGCTEEALRLIRETRWQPAELKGKAVRYKMSYPITFSLQNYGKNELGPVMPVGN